MCELFFSINETEFASYTDDNTPYVRNYIIEDVINSLENNSIQLFKGTLMQFEYLPIFLSSYENNVMKISHYSFNAWW